MKKQIPIFDKDKEEKVWIKVRKLDTDFNMDEDNHRHTFEELIWIKSGIGSQLIDNELYIIQPNTLYLISKGQVHNFKEGKNIEAYVVGFDQNFLKAYSPFRFSMITNLLENLKNFNTLPLTSPIMEELDLVIQQMLTEYQKPKGTSTKYDTLNCFLLILLMLIERHIQQLQPTKEKVTTDYKFYIFQEFLQLVDLNFMQQHSLSFYVNELGVSTRSLTSYTKKYTDKSAKKILSERIITEAKRLLSFTPQSLKEISNSLGFEETSYFIRFFRKHTHKTPGIYRATNQILN